MAGTLVVSRETNNHAYFKQRFEALGFSDVTLTAKENDALAMLIRDMKPDQIIMGARFHECATPYRMRELREKFPHIYMAAVCIGSYPVKLGKAFIDNKINAYLSSGEGVDQFRSGLDEIRRGNEYISPAVQKSIYEQSECSPPAHHVTGRELEVVRLICNGYKDQSIAKTLAISRNTVVNHKTSLFRSLNVSNSIGLMGRALKSGVITLDELGFCPNEE